MSRDLVRRLQRCNVDFANLRVHIIRGVHLKKKRRTTVIGAIFLLGVVFFVLVGNPIILKNKYNLGQSIKAISTKGITLNEIVPFEWNKVYTFDPYTTKQEIERIIGFQSNNISETVSEGMTQLIFVKGNRIVCDICGYSDNLGYSVSFSTNNGSYSIIKYEDNATFSVERIGNIVVLSSQ